MSPITPTSPGHSPTPEAQPIKNEAAPLDETPPNIKDGAPLNNYKLKPINPDEKFLLEAVPFCGLIPVYKLLRY